MPLPWTVTHIQGLMGACRSRRSCALTFSTSSCHSCCNGAPTSTEHMIPQMDPNGCYDCFLNSPLISISSLAPKNDLSSHCRAWTARRRRSAPKTERWKSRCTWRHQQWEVVRSLNMASSCNMQGWGCNQQKLGVIHQETKTTKRNTNGYQRISDIKRMGPLIPRIQPPESPEFAKLNFQTGPAQHAQPQSLRASLLIWR